MEVEPFVGDCTLGDVDPFKGDSTWERFLSGRDLEFNMGFILITPALGILHQKVLP